MHCTLKFIDNFRRDISVFFFLSFLSLVKQFCIEYYKRKKQVKHIFSTSRNISKKKKITFGGEGGGCEIYVHNMTLLNC